MEGEKIHQWEDKKYINGRKKYINGKIKNISMEEFKNISMEG